MFHAMILLAAVVPVFAAPMPLEADFPDGYWDQEVGAYAGRAMVTYNVGIVVEDPAQARTEVEAALKVPGSKLINFSDQTLTSYPAGMDYGGMGRLRPAYTISYQLPDVRSAAVAHRLIALGRLISYNTQTPFANPQKKELDDRIDWIEKELANSASALKTMPVSRALLGSKLKRLRLAAEGVKASAGVATITVQIMRESPEAGPKPAAVPAP